MRRLLWAHELELNALRMSLVILVLVKDESLKGQLAEVRRVWQETHGQSKHEKLTADGDQQMSDGAKKASSKDTPHENLKVLTHSWCLNVMKDWNFSQSAQIAYDAVVLMPSQHVHLGLVRVAPRHKTPAAGKPWAFQVSFTGGNFGNRLQEFWNLVCDWSAQQPVAEAPLSVIRPGLRAGALAQTVHSSLPASQQSSKRRGSPLEQES
eukprot:4805947-Amphidinium_carterae.2